MLSSPGKILIPDGAVFNAGLALSTQVKGSSLIMDLNAQVRASVIDTSNSVSQWQDQSQYGNHVNATVKPVYSATSCNSLPGISSNGTSQFMATAASIIASGSPYTLSAVVSGDDLTGTSVAVAIAADHQALQLQNATSVPLRVYQNNVPGALSCLHLTQGQPYILTAVYRGINAYIDMYINGMIVGQTPAGSTYAYVTNVFQLFAFTSGGGAYGKCTLGRVMLYNRALSVSEINQNHDYLSAEWNIAVNPYKNYDLDVFVANGQSNEPGRYGPANPFTTDIGQDKVYQLGRWNLNDGQIMYGFDSLQYPDANFSTVVGSALTFAKYYATNTMGVGRAALIVPCAFGGSGFSNNYWNPGNAGYEEMVTRVQSVLRRFPTANLKGFLWTGGEADQAYTQAQYATAFDAMYGNFISRVRGGPSCGLLVGQLLIGGNLTGAGVSAALADTPNRWAHSGFVASTGFTGGGDNVHYSAAEQRTFGTRFGVAYAALT